MMSPSDASSQCVPETVFDMAASMGPLSVLNGMEWKSPYIDEKTMPVRHSVYVCILFFVESGFYVAASFYEGGRSCRTEMWQRRLKRLMTGSVSAVNGRNTGDLW